MKTLIVTPTYNERENLPRFVAEVRVAAPDADVMVVDDASPDGTGDLADELAAARPSRPRDPPPRQARPRYGVRRRVPLGTCRTGYDRFFEMDADLSHDPKYLPDFFRALDDGADVVIGSRNMPGGGVEGWGVGRHILSKGGSLYARTILGLGVHDLTAGFKAFTRRALEAIDLESVRSNGYSFQIEMTYRAHLRGLPNRGDARSSSWTGAWGTRR